MFKVWASVIVLATLNFIPNIAENVNSKGNSSQDHSEEVKKWPKVFVLSFDPENPIVCYSGPLVIIPLNQTEGNSTVDKSGEKMFNLSSDPLYPVVCRMEPIPQHLANDKGAGYEKVSCIRRDYEGGIAAVFFFKVGPLKEAWNVFNSTIPYGYMNVKDYETINPEPKILKEAVVDCDEYGIPTDDKCIISAGAAASLCG